MIVLDTNVISEVFSRKPHETALAWLNDQEETSLFLCTIVLGELHFGARLVREEERKRRLLDNIGVIVGNFSSRILPFSEPSAEIYGRLTAERQLAGRRMETKDAMIAAICIANGATLATRNVRDFDGLDLTLVNPFEADA